ncbi:class I SAM-dependent methyltransferase [Uliginosibacterium sp. sgz301328]|uniref:class I SAM-dependent methyltransferase n=1 Tax=Uliginosibacterium sp. sgz301328 TaxID=3243764 RepID=UPI00359D3D90
MLLLPQAAPDIGETSMQISVNPYELPAAPRDCECKICRGHSGIVALIDASQSSIDFRAGKKVDPYVGKPVYYYRCQACGFTFTPYFDTWSVDDFATHIYNAEYGPLYDPAYLGARPRYNANIIFNSFGKCRENLRVLDYGSGLGMLADLLREGGCARTASFDPFTHVERPEGVFNMVTSFEVFEHSTDPDTLMADVTSFVAEDGAVLFSTVLCTQAHIDRGLQNWWYCTPRNGHVSFYTPESLRILARRYGLAFHSFDDAYHAFYRPSRLPIWLNAV